MMCLAKRLILLTLPLLAQTAFGNQALRGKSFGQGHVKYKKTQRVLIIDQTMATRPHHDLSHEDIEAFIPTQYNNINHPYIIRTRMLERTGNPFMTTVNDGNFIRDGINGKDQGSLMETTDDEAYMRSRVMAKAGIAVMNSQTAQRWIRSQKDNFLVQTARNLEADFNFKDDEEPTSESKKNNAPKYFNAYHRNMDHHLKFDMQTLKGRAIVKYQGVVNSQLEYHAGANVLRFSITEKITQNSQIALTHQKDRFEDRQFLQYHMSW